MKVSFYNHVLYDGGWGYWFNALTRSYFRLSDALSRKVDNLLASEEGIDSLKTLPVFDLLSEHGFLIKDEVNELDVIRSYHRRAVDAKDYFLVILPTLNCNYRCWYCIQDHIPSLMNDEEMDSVRNHIRYMDTEEHITSLHIDWFGG